MNEQTFTGQVAVITGAGTGIGFEIARQLVHRGARVVLNDIDPELARAAAKKINKTEEVVLTVSGDSSELECIQRIISRAIEQFGRLDLVVANAGITTFGAFLDYTPQQFQRLVAVNLQGTFFLAQMSARHMIRQGTGRILLMSSVTGHQVHPDLAAYSMTKAALEMLAKSLGVELAAYGITVNAVAPGATLTERTVRSDPNYERSWQKITPTGRPASPEDIAHAALFLLSPRSGQITGQTIIVDGGWTAVSPAPDS